MALLILMVMKMGASDNGEYDRERNLIYSRKGTYGTAGFMTRKELKGVLDLVPDVRKHHGTILGLLDGQIVCVPEKTRLNSNLAVYGASGSKKTRAFCINRILQAASKPTGESLIICDPKSELYEQTSTYLRDKGYIVKVFNLVTPHSSDSWNCLAEIEGQELMAQLLCDVVIKNTGSERGDHFWDNAELNLLKALVLYVEQGYPADKRNIGEVYTLLTMSSEKELNSLFDVLPVDHPAKAPYRETSGVGRRRLMTMDEVLRLDIDRALVIVRGKKVLEVDKYDFSNHPESKKLHPSKASAHVPAWQSKLKNASPPAPVPTKYKSRKKGQTASAPDAHMSHDSASTGPGPTVVTVSKNSIMKRPEKKED